MRRFLTLIAFSLQAALALAQPAEAPKPAAAPEKPAATPAANPPAEPRRPLILRLDEVDGPKMSFGASQGEKYQSEALPGLGSGARQLDPSWSPRTTPYPHSSDNLQ
jgi:hypothetical protein